MEQFPRVLVISHNVFSDLSAMGKSLKSLLSCVPTDNLAQLYFHSEVPTTDVCKNYLRIRDQDVLSSIITRNAKCSVYSEKDVEYNRDRSRTDSGVIAKVYQYSRKRKPWMYNLRNLMWKLGRWNTRELRKWIDGFSPEIIFFASGDYSFAYSVACLLSEELDIPIVTWCCDDYYICRRYADTVGGRYCYRNLMKWVKRVSARTESVIVISDEMKRDYAGIFDKPIYVMRISAQENKNALPVSKRTGIAYIGGLGVNRITPLVELGRKLKSERIPGFEYIDVYSGDRNEKTLAYLTENNGIRFHGSVPGEQVSGILGSAKYILHVEAFDELSKSRTKYSLSTKIGESLKSGACIIAYGPRDISSISYLLENDAARVLDSAEELPTTIRELNNRQDLYLHYVKKALETAEKNHNKESNDLMMANILKGLPQKGGIIFEE